MNLLLQTNMDSEPSSQNPADMTAFVSFNITNRIIDLFSHFQM
jgi:hypothetical protein